MDDNKTKALQAALAQIEKQFGKGSIMKMGEGLATDDIQTVSTGSLGLDLALGGHLGLHLEHPHPRVNLDQQLAQGGRRNAVLLGRIGRKIGRLRHGRQTPGN